MMPTVIVTFPRLKGRSCQAVMPRSLYKVRCQHHDTLQKAAAIP